MTLNILLYVSIGLFVLVVVGIIIDRSLAYKKRKRERQTENTPSCPQNVQESIENKEEAGTCEAEAEKESQQDEVKELKIGDIEDEIEYTDEKNQKEENEMWFRRKAKKEKKNKVEEQIVEVEQSTENVAELVTATDETVAETIVETTVETAVQEVPSAEAIKEEKPATQSIVGTVGMGKVTMFTFKISGANPIVQENYDRINNAILSYKETERFFDGSFVDYKKNGKLFARLVVVGSALKLYLDLAYSVADPKIYFHKETEEVAGCRVVMNIKSDKAGKNAVELVNILANKKHFEKDENYTVINSVAELKELNKR